MMNILSFCAKRSEVAESTSLRAGSIMKIQKISSLRGAQRRSNPANWKIPCSIIIVVIITLFPTTQTAFAEETTDPPITTEEGIDEPEAPPNLADAIYLKTDEPGSDGKTHFVGEDFDKKYKTLSITVKGKTIQLNGYYTTTQADGDMYEAADTTSPLGPLLLQWASSDDEIATVSPDGLITPVKDGEVTISAKISEVASEESKYEGTAPSKSVSLIVSGQTAEYVKSVTIIDEDGKSLSSKDDGQTIISGANLFFSFYALIVWHDPNTDTDRTEDTRTDTVTSTITWSVGGSSVAGTINEDTGRFKSTEFSGNCYVQCKVTGGVTGKAVTDIARVQVDTGEYDYKPASSLTLKVIYQEFPDEVVQQHSYALDDLAAGLASYTNSYTVLAGSRYGTIRATGYLFKDVLALEGVDIEDVYQYRFTTADGYDNPITSKLLYGSGARYYFPNWDISSKSGAQVVPPLLAYSSNLIWGASEVDPGAPLDDATRFRLVFGPLWTAEANSSFQIYYIQAVTIVLKGAPPADNDEGKGEDKGDGDDGGKDPEDKPAPPAGDGGSGDGAGGGQGDGTEGGEGSGKGDGTGAGNGGGKGEANGAASTGSNVGNSGGGGQTGTDPNSKAETGKRTNNVFAGKGAKQGQPGGGYKIYEMISNSKSNVAPLDMDLPYLPLAIPVACGGVAAGGLSFYVGFRRRLAV